MTTIIQEINVGVLVLYDCEGAYRFEGLVEELNFEAGKALVCWIHAGFGTRRSWLGFSRLTLLVKAKALAVEATEAG